MARPLADDLKRWLHEPLADAIGDRFGRIEISLLSQKDIVADGTTVFHLRGSDDRLFGVLLCSAPLAPNMVNRAMTRARQAKAILGATVGGPILDPLVEGYVHGLSYAVLPYCNELSELRPIWWIQRVFLRPRILEWLRRATEHTASNVELAAIDRSFSEPLQRIASLDLINDRLRAAASHAAKVLYTGGWTPRYVLMHGDLWKGNILIRTANRVGEQQNWRDRFVIIDWAGSEIHGYAMYDLVRLGQSMRLNAGTLRREVERHCRLLRCAPNHAMYYLLAALGHILINLEHFPIDRYARMAESCVAALEHAME